MKAHPLYWIFFIVIFILAVSGKVFSEGGKVEPAKMASKTWLTVVDGKNYVESWDTLAVLLRKKLTRSSWGREVASIREPLGKLRARKLLGAKYVKDLPDAPEGEYVVIQYQSSFENNVKVLETVVPMLEEDGNWRIAGYFIKGMIQ